jgi:hypothetical protein
MTTRRDGRPVSPDDEDAYLADVAIDPFEEVNRAADPAYAAVRAELRDAILRHVSGALESSSVPQFSDAQRASRRSGEPSTTNKDRALSSSSLSISAESSWPSRTATRHLDLLPANLADPDARRRGGDMMVVSRLSHRS